MQNNEKMKQAAIAIQDAEKWANTYMICQEYANDSDYIYLCNKGRNKANEILGYDISDKEYEDLLFADY